MFKVSPGHRDQLVRIYYKDVEINYYKHIILKCYAGMPGLKGDRGDTG